MTRMFNHPHPGLTLRDDVLPALGLSVTQAAEQLGVARGGDACVWMAQQSAYDMWQAEQRFKVAPMRVSCSHRCRSAAVSTLKWTKPCTGGYMNTINKKPNHC